MHDESESAKRRATDLGVGLDVDDMKFNKKLEKLGADARQKQDQFDEDE